MWPKFYWPRAGFSRLDPEQQQLCEMEEAKEKRQPLWTRRLVANVALFLFALLVLINLYIYISEQHRYPQEFEKFKQKYQRNYTVEEEPKRKEIFVKNMKKWEADEQRSNRVLHLGVTEFADQTKAELNEMLMSKDELVDLTKSRLLFRPKGYKRPESVDWRAKGKVTPVKNQAPCPTCSSFAVVAAIESAYAIKRIKTNQSLSLSEQQLIDCHKKGPLLDSFQWIKENGLTHERAYPYTNQCTGYCQSNGSTTNFIVIKKKVYIDDYILLAKDEDVIADWVAKRGPVAFSMAVTDEFHPYRSGIYHPTDEECRNNAVGRHALAIVGYGVEDGQPFWWVKNSWGSDWGINGYFKLARGHNACGMAENVIAPVID